MSIVVVDDDTAVRKLIVDVMKFSVNRDVVSFSNGLSAWNYLSQDNGKTDIIISDVDMPDMDGLQLLSKVMEHDSEKIMIMMSGNSDYKENSIKSGAKLFLNKPFRIKELFNIVENFVVK